MHDSHAEGFLQLAMFLVREGVADGSLPFLFVEDLCEGNTLDECKWLFSLLENNAEALCEDIFLSRGKLTLLRLSNGLLRRASRTADNVFCGRVLLFLAYALPLSERSGVNLQSAFNVDNVTEMDEEALAENSEAPHILDVTGTLFVVLLVMTMLQMLRWMYIFTKHFGGCSSILRNLR